MTTEIVMVMRDMSREAAISIVMKMRKVGTETIVKEAKKADMVKEMRMEVTEATLKEMKMIEMIEMIETIEMIEMIEVSTTERENMDMDTDMDIREKDVRS